MSAEAGQSREEREARQREEILRFLSALFEPGQVIELRALDYDPRNRWPQTASGYFDDREKLVDAALHTSPVSRGTYVVMNEIDPALLARRANELHTVSKSDPLTGNHEVVRRRWLFVDLDPIRPSGISSTDAEHQAALERARQVREALATQGWPAPFILDSGNGAALLYRVDLSPDDGDLVKRVLEALALRFNDGLVEIDSSVHNPARLVRLAGTLNRKGSHTTQRPHRYARIVELPERTVAVPEDLLQALAADAPENAKSTPHAARNNGASGFDLERWIAENHLDVEGPESWNGGRIWKFRICPWDTSHTNASAVVGQLPNGALFAKCHHNGCAGKGWKDLRDVIEPGWRDARRAPAEPRGEEAAGSNNDEEPADASSSAQNWPEEMAPEAFHGPAGGLVKVLEPHTESDPAGLLLTFLTCFGNAVGDAPHFLAEDDKHPPRLFVCLVGDTSKGRKGTSRGRILRVFDAVDSSWVATNVKSGLSSGEGLIFHVRDPIEREEPIREKRRVVGYETVVVDRGVTDKRMLVLEDEFASALKVLRREGNTLSPTLRRAWDSGNLHILTKNNPIRATGSHVSLLGHITRQELLRHLTETEYANGFGNRFLWVLVRRSRILPFGGSLNEQALAPVVDSVRSAIAFAATQRQIPRDAEADRLWGDIYSHLSSAGPGLLGAITARAEAQTVRLALIYALLDQSPVIRLVHLEAALAVWAYAYNSATCIFGLKTGDPVADKVLENLQKCSDGTTVTALHRAFSNNLQGNRLSEALRTLEKEGLARQHVINLEEGAELRWFAKV